MAFYKRRKSAILESNSTGLPVAAAPKTVRNVQFAVMET